MTWSDTGLPGLCPDEEAALGGEGTPLVAAFTPEPFAAALGVSTLTGLQLLADALDLEHRLPRLWAAVEALAVAPWKARKIAQATDHLSQAAAASVERPARGPDRVVWVAGHRDRGRPGHRHPRPAPARDPGEAGPGRLGGAALPPRRRHRRRRRLGRHLPPGGPRRHPASSPPSTTWSVSRPPNSKPWATPTPSTPQSQGRRRDPNRQAALDLGTLSDRRRFPDLTGGIPCRRRPRPSSTSTSH